MEIRKPVNHFKIATFHIAQFSHACQKLAEISHGEAGVFRRKPQRSDDGSPFGSLAQRRLRAYCDGSEQAYEFALPRPLYPQKRTCAVQLGMSALGQKRTSRGLFNYLVGPGRSGWWHCNAERLRGAQIDHELELGHLHYRQISRFFAIENTTSIDPGLTIGIGKVGSIAHQTAGFGKFVPLIDRRHRMTCRQHDKLLTPAIKERGGADQERPRPLLDEGRERYVEIALYIGAGNNELHPQLGRRLLQVAQLRTGSRKVWVDEHSNGRNLRNHFMQ